MKAANKIYLVTFILCLLCVTQLSATVLQDNFDSGISPNTWRCYDLTNGQVPVSIIAPDKSGRLQIAKSADQSQTHLNTSFEYGLMSNFSLQGDFAVSVEYSLVSFPAASPSGFSDAFLRISGDGIDFTVWRAADAQGNQFAGVAGGGSPGFGLLPDSSTDGKFGLTRIDNTITGWIDSGTGIRELGSYTAPSVGNEVHTGLLISQYINLSTGLRSEMAMDVRFDNFSSTAEMISPEPTTLLLLVLGGMIIKRNQFKRS
jgi:hypothetical protein